MPHVPCIVWFLTQKSSDSLHHGTHSAPQWKAWRSSASLSAGSAKAAQHCCRSSAALAKLHCANPENPWLAVPPVPPVPPVKSLKRPCATRAKAWHKACGIGAAAAEMWRCTAVVHKSWRSLASCKRRTRFSLESSASPQGHDQAQHTVQFLVTPHTSAQ